MKLAPGVRLGPYEIVAQIGAGGMGEVYRARDTRLGRTVAIKVLPGEFSSDAKLRLRFEREAKAISSLNHPHICGIYEVGRENGRDYLVMEYLEGESLSHRLARGALSVDQVLRYGIDIADALDKAHRQGIIHRDLKPSNIMITKSGAKLLDFGLAKSQAGGASIWDQAKSKVSQLPTAEKPLTAEGTLVGTLEYMAPEQLEGKHAEARTDIFALGGVLYRMATGKRPFEGHSDASLIASILERDPPPITSLQPLAPPALDRLVRSCLAKDPDERIQTAHDVLLQLRWISEGVSYPSLPASAVTRRRTSTLLWLAAGLVVAGVAALATWHATRADREPFRAERFQLQPPSRVHVAESAAASVLAMSPDGEWVAFRGESGEPGRSGLYLRSTKELDARLIASSIGVGNTPFFSPDSKWVGFFADGAMQKVSVGGGEPRRICEAPRLRGASWGDDGTILFSVGGGLLRVSADGGQPEVLTVPPTGELHLWPQFLPGSREALFVVHRGFSTSWHHVALISMKSREIRTFFSGTSPRFLRGRLVYSHLGTLSAVHFDVKGLKPSGEPKAILDDVHIQYSSGYTAFDLSENGALAYIPGAPRVRETELVWLDREGQVTPLLRDKRGYDAAAVAPDGKRVAVIIRTTLEDADLWTYELGRGGWTRLTFGKRLEYEPVWSADGQWIIFNSFVSGHGNLFRIRADGSGTPEQLTFGVKWDSNSSISPDGKTLVFARQVQAAQWDLLTLSLERVGDPRPFLATPVLERLPAFSPDGNWIAYESDETGRREVHVRPYPGPGNRVTVSTDGGLLPSWSSDGRELFYRKGPEIWSVGVSTDGGFRAGRPQLLFKSEFLSPNIWDRVDFSRDGKRMLTIRYPPESQPERRLVYVPNWIAELEHLYGRHP